MRARERGGFKIVPGFQMAGRTAPELRQRITGEDRGLSSSQLILAGPNMSWVSSKCEHEG